MTVVLSLFAQHFVVGELFINNDDTTAPSALAAFRAIHDDNDFVDFFPLIWKQDTEPESAYERRVRGYNNSAMPTPMVLWNATTPSIHTESDHNAIPYYRKAFTAAESSQQIPQFPYLELDFEGAPYPYFKGNENEYLLVPPYTITAVDGTFNEANTQIYYILTYEEDYEYFASVVVFSEGAGDDNNPFPFPTNIVGTAGVPEKFFDLGLLFDELPEPNKLTLTVLVQRSIPPFEIFYAAQYPLADTPPPTNVRYFAAENRVTLQWDPPLAGHDGYLVTMVLAEGEDKSETVNIPIFEFDPDDYSDEPAYNILISAIYNLESELVSDPVVVSIPKVSADFIDLGVGTFVSGVQSATPLNTYQKAMRSQFIYTFTELAFAGITGENAIYGIGLNVVDMPILPFLNYTVRVREVQQTDVSNHLGGTEENFFNYVVTNATFDASDAVIDGWVMFNFVANPENQVPFVWGGKENLLVDISFGPNTTTGPRGAINMFKSQYGFRYSWTDENSLLNHTTEIAMPYKPALRIVRTTVLPDVENPIIATRDRLINNFPNPFNPSTTISFDIVSDTNVRIDVYNIKGQLVKTLVDAPYTVGAHSVNWDGKDSVGRDVASGVYLYRMNTESHSDVKKMVLMK
jgi:hypothetical protein